jgi:hypothetical protein
MSNSSHRLERAYQAGLAAVWEQLVRLDRELEGMTNERSLAARARIRREIHRPSRAVKASDQVRSITNNSA